MNRPVYFDYAAATPTDSRVIEAMVACMSADGCFGNPHAKDHVYGWEAMEAVENARAQVASLVGASPLEIFFTSGATESNNLSIFGLSAGLRERGDRRNHIITSLIEHKAILESCEQLEKQGYRVTYLKPDRSGIISLQNVEEHLDDDTFLVSVAQVNSVLGSVSDVHAIAALCHSHGIYFHTDVAQSVGYLKMDYDSSDIDLVSLTSEKVYGPKGIGALFVKRQSNPPLKAMIYGGGQEKGMRGGTLATHEVVGFGCSFELLGKEARDDYNRFVKIRKRIIEGISGIKGLVVNGSSDHNLPQILSVSFKGVDGASLLPSLTGIAASTGSACSSASLEPSYVLKAIGHSDELARASLRLSFGRFTTDAEVEKLITELNSKVPALQHF